jgi:hypothetical protein
MTEESANELYQKLEKKFPDWTINHNPMGSIQIYDARQSVVTTVINLHYNPPLTSISIEVRPVIRKDQIKSIPPIKQAIADTDRSHLSSEECAELGNWTFTNNGYLLFTSSVSSPEKTIAKVEEIVQQVMAIEAILEMVNRLASTCLSFKFKPAQIEALTTHFLGQIPSVLEPYDDF